MRLPYVSNQPADFGLVDQDILQRIAMRRGRHGLLALDLTLLHAPKIADGWHSLFGRIYDSPMLPTDLLEIAICRVALLNRAQYQWDGHAATLRALVGFGSEKMSVVETLDPSSPGALNETQWAVLKYADAMTKDITVSDSIFNELSRVGLVNKEIVELTAAIAAYNGVSRFLVALDVGEKNRLPKLDVNKPA